MHITPLGDSALLVQVRERLASQAEATLQEVVSVWRTLEAATLPGVIEVAPAYTTVAVYFDPLRLPREAASDPLGWLGDRILAVVGTAVKSAPPPSRVVEIPVCYGGKHGLDLAAVAEHAGLSEEEVVARHAAGEYLVHCLGFTPGFAYLSGLAPELAMPRRSSPRKKVPAGSVGIGGAQTGVYPLDSPGGWQIIGWTPLVLFDPHSDSPTLLQVGDRVRFRAMTAAEMAPTRDKRAHGPGN